MKMPDNIAENMIAPCGVPCFACMRVFPKKKAPCPGCRAQDVGQIRKSCQICEIRQCVNERALRFCAECEDFPCAALKPLFKRYLSIHKIDLAKNGRRGCPRYNDVFDGTASALYLPILRRHHQYALQCLQ